MGTNLEWPPKKEPPYAEPHVRWCERSENESRKKTTSFSSYSIWTNCWTISFLIKYISYIIMKPVPIIISGLSIYGLKNKNRVMHEIRGKFCGME